MRLKMKIKPFKLERFFAKHEFTAPWLLCCSDCEALGMKELLEMADNQCLGLWDNLSLGYTESSGLPLLREEISGMYKNIGPENILVSAPEEAIFIAMNLLLKPGDQVVASFPAYQSLYSIAESMGCSVNRWRPVKEPESSGAGPLWKFRFQDLQKLVGPETSLIVINFPHNPTGASLDQNELEKILELAGHYGIPVFSDEMYRYLEHDQSSRPDSAADLYERAISLFGMSKSFSLPGLRIGWLASRDMSFLKQAACFKDYTTICSSGPSEILALMGIRAKKRIIEKNLLLIRENLLLLDGFFHKYRGIFEWKRPAAGPIGLVGLKTGALGIESADSFCSDLVSKRGVLLAPASCFDYEEQAFRVGFARKNLPQCVEQVDLYLKKQGMV
jgi:aspartate/methionine/tyrosine aminotransferase